MDLTSNGTAIEDEMQSDFYEHRKRRENGKEILELKLARIERAVNLMDIKLTEALRILESYGEKE